jgi:hypothetical protein
MTSLKIFVPFCAIRFIQNAMKTKWGNGGTAPYINLGTRLRWVVNFTPSAALPGVRAPVLTGYETGRISASVWTRWRWEKNPITAPAGNSTPVVQRFYWLSYPYELTIGGSSPGKGCEFFSSSPRQDRLWGPHNLLSIGYQELFPWG